MKVWISDHRKAFNVMDEKFCHIKGSTGENKISDSREKGCNMNLISYLEDENWFSSRGKVKVPPSKLGSS